MGFDIDSLTYCNHADTKPQTADLKERIMVREQIESNLDTIDVIVTTYAMAKTKDDNKFIRHLKPVVSA